MTQSIERESVCKSVFKSGKDTVTEQEFTDKWVELVNALEKSKSVAV